MFHFHSAALLENLKVESGKDIICSAKLKDYY